MKQQRKFGEIPLWAKQGPINLKNYDLRVENYGAEIKKWRDHWPFLSSDPGWPSTADHGAWHYYFESHLGGFPPSYQAFMLGKMKFLNMPEATPELFDTSFEAWTTYPPPPRPIE